MATMEFPPVPEHPAVDADAEDLGVLPYLPMHAPPGESFEALKQRGMLRDMMDLVR